MKYFFFIFCIFHFLPFALYAQYICPPPYSDELHASVYPDSVFISGQTTLNLLIEVNADTLPQNAVLKIGYIKGLGAPLQIADSSAENYCTAKTNRPGVSANIVSIKTGKDDLFYLWDFDGSKSQIVTIKIEGGNLYAGDTIRVVFGDNPPYGKINIPSNAFVDSFKIAYDFENDGTFLQTSVSPKLYIIPSATPGYIYGYIASDAKPGDTVLLKFRVYDIAYNKILYFTGTFQLASTDASAILPASITITPADSGAVDIPVVFNSAGIQRITIIPAGDAALLFSERTTNAIQISDSVQEHIYWGDVHSHQNVSRDGHGAQAVKYARDAAALDFYAATDHADGSGSVKDGINCEEYKQQVNEVSQFNEQGKFVTFFGFENSMNTTKGGHHQYIYDYADSLIDSIPVFYSQENIFEIWAAADATLPAGIRMICIAHHSGKQFNPADTATNSANHFGPGNWNPYYRTTIEICSSHGQSEYYNPADPLSYENASGGKSVDGPYYARDAWALGEKLGVIASSDDHKAQPGNLRKGIAAVFANQYNRTSLFNSIYNKHTYGTTGERILFYFNAGDSLMGSTIQLPEKEKPQFQIKIYGTNTIEYVNIMKWDFENGIYLNGHPVYDTVARYEPAAIDFTTSFTDSSFSNCALYYVSMKQITDVNLPGGIVNVDAARAWSSPIWVYSSDVFSNYTCTYYTDIPTENIPYQIEIFPNPNAGIFSILMNNLLPGNYSLVISNMLGHITYKNEISFLDNFLNYTVSIPDLSKGMYMITLLGNKSRYSAKFNVN